MFAGFECFQFCWGGIFKLNSDGIGAWIYFSSFVLDNLLFPILIASLFMKSRFMWLTRLLAVAAMLHVLSWLVLEIVSRGVGPDFSIKIGYFVWLAAYILLVVLVFKRRAECSPES